MGYPYLYFRIALCWDQGLATICWPGNPTLLGNGLSRSGEESKRVVRPMSVLFVRSRFVRGFQQGTSLHQNAGGPRLGSGFYWFLLSHHFNTRTAPQITIKSNPANPNRTHTSCHWCCLARWCSSDECRPGWRWPGVGVGGGR